DCRCPAQWLHAAQGVIEESDVWIGYGLHGAIVPGTGNPCVAHADLSNYAIRFTYWDGSQWCNEFVDTDFTFSGHGPLYQSYSQMSIGLGLGITELPRVAYGSDYLYYAQSDGTQWTVEPVVITGKVGEWVSMEITPADKAIVAYGGGLGAHVIMEQGAWPFDSSPVEGEGAVEGEILPEGAVEGEGGSGYCILTRE
ncbi:MAG TPA: hypothetical protein PLI09_23630, partial [Candidatus Hydrogenedentes bacterium]|nr:hypothetical protein [Candidatus Hydrogenedentota bacterium]